MKAAKRILAVALAMIFVLAVFAFPASALEGTMSFEVKTSKDTYTPGEAVTVDIYVSSNFNATCMRIPVLYSKDVFELPAGNDVRLTAYGDCLSKKNSLDVNTDLSDTPIELCNVTDSYDAASYGIVAIQWTASITSSVINSFSSAEPVKCFSFQLKVKQDAAEAGTILIPSAEELKPAFAFYNQAVTNPADATTICRVEATFNVDDWSVSIETGSNDDITTFPDSDVIIDKENLILKNWEDGMTKAVIEANVTTTGNATLTYKASSSGSWGTGAKVRLWNGSTWIADYKVLLYGDLDGNGSIKGTDGSMISRHLAGVIDLEDESAYDPIVFMAADINCDGAIKGTDASAISRYLAGAAEIDQAK